jgi:hypothetical protein
MKKLFRSLTAAMAMSFRHHLVACNIAGGVHADGNLTLKADAALSARFLRVKFGSDASHFALAGAEAALGICTDDPDAVEDSYNVALFGASKGTQVGVGSAAIAAGDYICGASGGKFQTMTSIANGTYYVEGKAVTACGGNNEEFEFVPCFPHAVTVAN